MKLYIILIYAAAFITCSGGHSMAQTTKKTFVGKLENGVPVLTADKTKMIAAYSANLLKMSNIEGGFIEVKIVTSADKQHYLVFKGTSYKSTLLIVADKSDLYAVGTTSCTTSDCSSEEWGCTPSASGMACTPCANQGKCTKTVTSFSMIE